MSAWSHITLLQPDHKGRIKNTQDSGFGSYILQNKNPVAKKLYIVIFMYINNKTITNLQETVPNDDINTLKLS